MWAELDPVLWIKHDLSISNIGSNRWFLSVIRLLNAVRKNRNLMSYVWLLYVTRQSSYVGWIYHSYRCFCTYVDSKVSQRRWTGSTVLYVPHQLVGKKKMVEKLYFTPTVKDWSPVMALPKIKAWISWVPVRNNHNTEWTSCIHLMRYL